MTVPIVQLNATVTVTANVDVVKHFTDIEQAHAESYWQMDPRRWGFQEEYERPLAWLTAWLDSEITSLGGAHPPGVSPGRLDGDVDWSGVRLPGHKDRFWTQEHFDALTAAVPWLTPPAEVREPTREELFRIPSYTDRPLPGLASAS